MSYYVYITTNPGKNVLYIGVTNNLARRMKEHRQGRGDWKHFTGKYYCHKLIYYEEWKSIVKAIKREKELKTFTRARKLELIKSMNPDLHFYRIY